MNWLETIDLAGKSQNEKVACLTRIDHIVEM